MRLASSLTNRIFLACAVVAALSLGFAFAFVNARASAEAEEELRRGVDEAGRLVDAHRVTLSDTFTRLARLIADLPKLKAAVETGDPPTVQPLADEYAAQMHADVLVLTSPDGRVLASSGAGGAGLTDTIGRAGATDELLAFLPHRLGLLQVVSVPLLLDGDLPAILGRLTAGFLLDDALAAQFKRLTASDVAFGAGGRIVAATLPQERRAAAATALDARTIRTVRLGDEEFLALARPLVAGDGGASAAAAAPVALILRSRTERLRFLTTIRTGLMAALAITVLAATLLSYAVARTMTRPLHAVTSAMREMSATGDLTRRVSLQSGAWDDEDARLLASAFNTMTESIDRFQKDAAQKERLSSLGRLSTVIAHEIRNPLMIIKASLPTLRRDGATPSERREAAADIDGETARINRLVSEVLDFARPIRFDLAEADVNEICRASASAVWADTSVGEVHLDLDPSIPSALTDAERLRTALVNLLSNARHAVEAVTVAGTGTEGGGGFRLRADDAGDSPVTISTRLAGDRVSIAVRDRGTGIAPGDITHIFDPYFTTRRAGTGLGLPIAKNIIEGLGGRITVASQPGDGTEIRIDLPLAGPGPRA
jgi:signal transduction histidine kinase